jgi:hypothetical protein
VLHELDPFEDQKNKAFTDSEEAIEVLLLYLRDVTEKMAASTEADKEEYLREFLQVSQGLFCIYPTCLVSKIN